MNDVTMMVLQNRRLTADVWEIILQGDTTAITRPGQFVNLKIEDCYLRRPISVCDINGDRLTLIYKVVGRGTALLSELHAGETLPVLTGLGNGYDLSLAGDAPLLLGGGVGVPPLYLLAKRLIEQGRTVQVVLGFNRKCEVFYEKEFRALGAKVTVTTADGSYGAKGFVTDALPEHYSHVYTCGPEPMLRAVYRKIRTSGSFSFESRMGCGFGACMGCSCKTITGYKRICKDGPILEKEEIRWED